MTMDGMQAAASIASSGILKIPILDMAITAQWSIRIKAKKFIFSLNAISTPSMNRATELGSTGVVISGNSRPRSMETAGYARGRTSMMMPHGLYFPDFPNVENRVRRSYSQAAAIRHQKMVMTFEYSLDAPNFM